MFLKMIAELTPCAKAVSTACSGSHSLPSTFPTKVKSGLLWIYTEVFILLIRPLMTWSLFFPPLSPNILPNFSFQHLSQRQEPLSNITRPQPLKESVSKQALLHPSGATRLRKASHNHNIVKKWRLTREEETKKSCNPFFCKVLSVPLKRERTEHPCSVPSCIWDSSPLVPQPCLNTKPCVCTSFLPGCLSQSSVRNMLNLAISAAVRGAWSQ